MIHPNLHTPNCCIANAGDKRFRLRALCADADCIRFVANTLVADIDVVIACGEIESGLSAQRDVEGTGCVPMSAFLPLAVLPAAVVLLLERLKPLAVLLLPVVLFSSALTAAGRVVLPPSGCCRKSADRPLAVFCTAGCVV